MPTTKAIKFRFLASQLTNVETHQFINKLINDNINTVISAIFYYQMVNTSQTDYINNTISNIILSRKKKPKLIAIENIKLDQIPRKLIGVIASFLNQYEYINFSYTNRFIFLGCNTPNTLKQLDLIQIRSYSSIHLQLFPSLKDLTLNIKQFNQLLSHRNCLPILNILESVELNANGENSMDIVNELPFDNLQFNNVTELSCSLFGQANNVFHTHENYFSPNDFLNFLAIFPNVKYLRLYGVFMNCDVNRIKEIYPNLKGLAVNGGTNLCNKSLINIYGSNLNYLKLFEWESIFDYGFCNVNFNSLKQLILFRPTNKSISDILLTAENLEKITISATVPSEGILDPPFIRSDDTKKIMTKVITSCKLLEYIEFDVHFSVAGGLIVSALDGIENGLFETKQWKRNKMKIVIKVYCDNNFNSKDFIVNIGKIIHWLDCSNIKDFMFVWALADLNGKIDRNDILKDLKSKCLLINTQIDMIGDYFAITNNNCKIEGVFESFEM